MSVGSSNVGNHVANKAANRMEEMKDQASGMMDSVTESVKDMGSKAARAARDGLHRVRDAAGEYYEEGRDRVMQFEHSMEDHIRSKPLQSLLIALGCGFALGYCMTHRS